MADGPTDPPGDDEPGEEINPFASFPMFGDIARALQGQGPLNWDAARQFAMLGATQGQPESNVDPAVRIAYIDLARIAGMHVNDVTGTDTTFPEPRIVTRGQWASETLDAYRPLFTDMATSLGQHDDLEAADDEAADPMMQMMSGLSRMMAPAMMGMSVGSMVGALSQRVFGLHDLPIPRGKPEVVLVGRTIDEFAADWDIPLDQMRLWVLAHELSGYRVFSLPHISETLAALVRRHVSGFRPDPSAIADKLGNVDPLSGSSDPMEALQQAFSDPEVLLGAVRSPEQIEMQPRLDAAVAAVVGYTDWVVDAVAARVVGGEALRIAEAVRRRRVESTPDDVFVEKLLGIRVGEDQVLRGKSFVQGVVDRVGEVGLTELLDRPESMPTPSEIDAPGLWIARLGDS
ncbi:MAG: zinc-dependent metalloprotease [Ilumatobacter sp.]|uniref:zinc-dependent metalloprotease n=1 Tax=Ilumatobacter sp. TaxID=1967498 RepID=UPI00262BBD11|nr:zinc-dependent metalloprotease [Ilumatobacter sp.]MDJ0771228.1 zinc-dependent metalloprotease [Ilumatobacter sp.]